MDPILITLIFIVLIITGIIISLLISNINESNVKNYYSKLPYQYQSIIKGDGKNMVHCPKGCDRGVCKHKAHCTNPNKQNCCIYDFQCNYCKDPVTQNYYLDSASNPKLTMKYNETNRKNQNTSDLSQLNNKIKLQNEYISKLNKEVYLINKKRGY